MRESFLFIFEIFRGEDRSTRALNSILLMNGR